MKKQLTLLVLILVIGCASLVKTTPKSMSSLKYGMNLSQVNKTLENKGGLIFRGIRVGRHYLGVYYEVGETFRKYCLIFEDDNLVAVVPFDSFARAWAAYAVSAGDKLPYEDGFDALHKALASNIIDLDHVDFAEVDSAALAEARRASIAGLNEALAWSWVIIPLSPVLIPALIVDSKRSDRFDEMWGKLSLQLPRKSVIELLGESYLTRAGKNSNYEIMIYERSGSQWDKPAIGIRDGKVEWMNRSGYRIYQQLKSYKD